MRTLAVRSTPSGADVTINDVRHGVTPLDVPDITPGVYSVTLSKEGYSDWKGDIEVTGSQSVVATLVREPAPPPPPAPPRIVTESKETRLSVFTDPIGAAVIVDGRSRGAGSPDVALTVSYQNKPTAAEVRVEKPGYVSWQEQVPLHADRDNRIFVKLDNLPEWYEFTSDAAFLKKVVDRATAKIVSVPALKAGAPIAIVPMERSTRENLPLSALIQDAFTQILTSAGYTTTERGDELLVSLAHSSSGDSLPLRVLTRHGGKDESPFVYDAEFATREKGEIERTTRRTTKTASEDGTVEEVETTISSMKNPFTITGHVATADQILAYRVLECGISKTPVVSGPARPEQMLFRMAKVRLHVRVIDAKTGIASWAGPLESEAVDEVPVRIAVMGGPPISEPYFDAAPGSAYPTPKFPARVLESE